MSFERKQQISRRQRRTGNTDEYIPLKRRRSWNVSMSEFDPADGTSSARGFMRQGSRHQTKTSSLQSLNIRLTETYSDDSFQKEVAEKTQKYFVGRQEAELEVLVSRLVEKESSKDNALLHVVSHFDNENKVQILVNTLLHQGANPSASNSELKTALHFAVEKNFRGVCYKLLENDAIANAKDRDGTTPLTIAYKNENDAIASLLIAYMSNKEVRRIYTSNGTCPADFSFHELLQKDMQNTVLAVMDCLIEPQSPSGHMTIYYHILDADENGRSPKQNGFNKDSRSPLQIMAKSGNKTLVYHDVVRLLIRKKWKDYAGTRFKINSIFYIFTLFAFTYSAVVAVTAPDPLDYNTALQVSRAVAEVFTYIMALWTFITELKQLKKHKLEYWHDPFNYIDLTSAILILVTLPLRLSKRNEQWHVLSVAFLLWTLRLFKYAAVFRQTGAYAQVLWRIFIHDFFQFTVVFLVILLAFSGALVLSLKGENSLELLNETSVGDGRQTNTTKQPSSSFEEVHLSTFWYILWLGGRILIEAESIIDYTELRPMSCIIMVMFLFTCIVILLNILIAQLSDTYQNVQQDAQRGLEVNRAWIVARVELNSSWIGLCVDYRTKYYTESENISDVRKVLGRWEIPPINEMNKCIKDIHDSLDSHIKMNLLTVGNRLARQETTLGKIQEQLDRLVNIYTIDRSETKERNHPIIFSTDEDSIKAPNDNIDEDLLKRLNDYVESHPNKA